MAGRIDAQLLSPPYRCDQVAHTVTDCHRFFVSTEFGTAQLCEWHKKCVASTVVDCLVAPPPPPPPLLTPPTPCGIRCRLANKLANSTHVKAARQAAGKLTATVGAGLGKVEGYVEPVLDRGADKIAARTGLPKAVVTAALVVGGSLLVVVAFLLLVVVPRARRAAERREAELAEAVEMFDRQQWERRADAIQRAVAPPGEDGDDGRRGRRGPRRYDQLTMRPQV